MLVPRVITVSSLCSSHAAMTTAHPQPLGAYRPAQLPHGDGDLKNTVDSKQIGFEQCPPALNSGVFKGHSVGKALTQMDFGSTIEYC